MGVVVEPGHEDDAVDTHLPLGPEHLLTVSPEGAGRRGGLAIGLCLEELLGLGEEDTNEADTDGDSG